MFNFNKKKEESILNQEPGLRYFKEQIGSSEHTFRQSNVNLIRKNMLRNHNVSKRLSHKFNFKGKEFTPAAIILQGMKTVVNFHTAYLVGNPVSLTGTPGAVEIFNAIYHKGIYSKIDWQILNDLMIYGNAFEYYRCIKYELDQLYQQFNLVAAIPSSILGQNNIANVSENSMSMVYQLTENRGKQNINSLIEGFRQRWEYMRKLMALKNNPITDDDFDSLNVSFNINKPIDTKQNFENMKIQYEMMGVYM